MTKILNFALKIKGGGREGGPCEVLRPCHPPKIWNVHHVELAHNLQSPDIPSHTQVREPQSAMRSQEQPRVQGSKVPAVQWRP